MLTGDIVGSSRLDAEALEAAMGALNQAVDEAAGWVAGHGARFTRFRGDGWQCLGPSPRLALRTVLYARAHLHTLDRRFDTRISVGIGHGHSLDAEDLAAAGGPAFEISGRGLARMPRAARLAIAWQEDRPDAEVVGAVFALSDEVSRRWTMRQAQVFARSLAPMRQTQASLVAALSVSQQMVAKHLGAGGDRAIRKALEALETACGVTTS